jgi:hypothetical protein
MKACAECKKEISTDAKVCPNCGKKDPHLTPGIRVFALLLMSLPVFAMCSVLGGKDDKGNSSSSTPTASAQDTAANRAAEDAACKQDLACWGNKHSVGAAVKCKRQIERLAKHAHEWTDGMLETKMSHFRWKDQNAGVVTFLGDKLRFQNGFGAWTNVVYECDYDGNVVFDARVHEGRL